MDELRIVRRAYTVGPQGPRGPLGPVGPKGEQGPIGLKGDKGDMGPIGPRGFQGPQGEKGDKGDVGSIGPIGPLGPKGDKGDQGIQGIQGPVGPQGPKGDVGEAFSIFNTYDSASSMNADKNNVPLNKFVMITSDVEDSDNADLYIRTDSEESGFKYITNLSGAQGIQGPKGDKGDKGDPFKYEDFTSEQLEQLRGPQGIQGPAGPKGDQGPQGIQGPKGADGTMTFEDLTEEQRESLRGPLGIQGPAGQDGVDGQDGAPGLDGHSPVVTASKSGSTTTIYVDGAPIATIEDGQDGQNGSNGTNGTNGSDGVTPHIDSTSKHWMIGSTDTGIVAEGHDAVYGTLATVATSGSYNDISDKPTIPTKTSDLTNDSGYVVKPDPNANGHVYVDLDLPSGTLWATINVGASSETDSGLYFQWGDTQGYSSSQIGTGSGLKSFSSNDYKWTQDNGSTFLKYNSTDGKYICDLEDDAANANWGGDWCLPSREDFYELINNTDWELFVSNRVTVFKAASKIDSSKYIIIPVTGYYSGTSLITESAGSLAGKLWGNYVADSNNTGHNDNSCGLTLEPISRYTHPYVGQSLLRWAGSTVRAVLHYPTNLHKVAITGSYNDLTDKPTIPTIWSGTQSQYDAITTPDSNTIYIITSAS